MTLKITSKIVLICTSLVVGTSVILGGFSLYRESQLLTETIVSKKRNEIELVTTYIQARIDELKNDVKLLSLTPPIQGFIRAEENNGFDPIDKSTSKQWRDRLATIFESLQRTKDHYVQIRLIGVQNNGKELVRVDQADSEIRRVFEGELQSKGNEGYFKKITSMTKEDFFFSKFSANKERGKVVVPVHMVLRVAMPIFNSRKTPFGFVVINVDYEEIFSRLKSLITKESEYFITNKGKEVVYHSHPMYNTKQSIHTFQMVEDEVPDLKNIFSSDKNLVLKGYHVGADKVIVANKIYFSLGNTLDFLHIFLTTDRSVVNQKVNGRVKDDLAIILSLVLFAVLLASYFSEFISNPIKVLTSYAENIGKENSKEILESSIHTNDEIGVLANTLAKMSDEIDAKNIMLVNQKDALDHSAIVDETDENGVITYVNDKLLEISKYSRKELLGQDHRILLSDVHSEDFFRNIQETVSSGQVWHGEVCNRAKDGSLFWVDTTVYPVTSNGKVEKYVAIRFDTTGRKEAEKNLLEATEKTRKATEAKSEFLANMSHEIRTPLNGVIGFANLLFDQKLTENQHEKVGIIKSCGEHLLSIINDFLDYSKIESGNLELEKTPFNIKEAFDSLTFLVNHLASQNGVNIHISIPDDIPQYLMGDITRLKQILINLTNNAVKFTKDGEIWISVTASAKQQGVYEYQFEVKDTGIGMSEEGQSKLFSVFTQADSSTTRKFGGTGLGLAISKNLTELMGGRIWVKSKLGEGSTFYFTISAEVVDSTMVETREKVKNTIDSEAGLVRPLEILVAEDNRINQKLIMGLLSKLNYQADLVDNGLKAVEAALKKKYDIIFMDVQMPEMDGLDATRKISARLIGSDKPVIVGVTANNMEGDRERCFASGMDEYIPKPIRITSLSEVLEKTYSKLKGNESGSVGDGADELNTPAYVDKELLLDQEALLMDYKDAPDVLHKVIGDFLANHNDLQSKINCAIQDQDAEALGACAHSLVSALTGLHANKAAEIASQLEKAAKSNQLLQAHRIYMSLLEEFDILVPLLWSLAGKNVA